MSQNNLPILYAGLDVAKLSLELHLNGRLHSFANDRKGQVQLLKQLRPFLQVQIICEATGGYEQSVVRMLQAAGIAVSILEGGRVRYFARAQGLRAKTDPIDAAVLTAYGMTFQPAPASPVSRQQQELADLAQRRRQLIQTVVAERNRSEHYTNEHCIRQNRQLLRLLEKQIQSCDQAISELIAADDQMAVQAQRLKAIPGVGQVVAATLLAEMPELGKLNRQTAAALAGLAPYNRDSGAQKGVRQISGGRRFARCALYMATLSAVRHDRILKEFYQRLRRAGKKPLVAMTACMRKLIILMNRLLKNPDFQLAS